MPADARQYSPAAERNKSPILAELRRLLPEQAKVLEIASGTGQHAAHFAAAEPGWTWFPTDADPRSLDSIAGWCEGLGNVRPPAELDVLAANWTGAPAPVDAILCANMLHISPPASCRALMAGAARHLAPAGALLVYGPFIVDGEQTAPSNLAFDADLKSRNPLWGLRRLADVVAAGAAAELGFERRIAMPANNLLLVFRRKPSDNPAHPVTR